MKILWVTNITLPEASLLLNEKVNPFGGWLVNASKDLSFSNEIRLIIASPRDNLDKISKLKGEKIDYILFPSTQKFRNVPKLLENSIESIILDERPDAVHIFGTEFSHSLVFTQICKKLRYNCLISIQGLTSVYAMHFMANIPNFIQKRYTFRDLLKIDNLENQKKKFYERGVNEIKALKHVNFIIGRTTWDKACTQQINSAAKYFHCNETLREVFYTKKWDISKCKRNTIFISQATYPIKGLHFMLEALPSIIKRFPDTKLFVAGYNILNNETLSSRLKQTYYTKYIIELVKKYKLSDRIVFTGILNEKEICEMYLNSHVFVCPSSIENSPNSLGEAMILGVPCVASYVGGIPDMLKDKDEGFLYQHDAPYMLAHYVCNIFENDELANKFSYNARKHALITHDPQRNTSQLLQIYREVVEGKE